MDGRGFGIELGRSSDHERSRYEASHRDRTQPNRRAGEPRSDLFPHRSESVWVQRDRQVALVILLAIDEALFQQSVYSLMILARLLAESGHGAGSSVPHTSFIDRELIQLPENRLAR